uniref:Uncharacterized protein n=1 Tax=Ciona intestinalis TaxID=7719 RepID=H2XN39_CIOIN
MTAQATPSITELDTFMSSIVNYIRNTSVDPEYCFEKDFKLEFKHRFVYPNQYPGYSQKILDLKAKNHSTEEILGFQLLPYKFCTNDMCLPMLNKGFMTELWKYQIQNRLLSHLQPQGISLYKSVDVLLKVMIQSNRRYAKIAVYKLMPGRTKVQFCCVEDLSREYENFKLDSEYDSGMLELLDETPVKYMSLRDQLMCSQIMVHELHEHKVDGRTMFFNEDAPRQITPVTVLTFTSLRPKFSLHTLGYNRILPATPAFVIEVKEGNVMMANGQ